MIEMASLLEDIEYLSGADATEVLAGLDEMDNFEVFYTLEELKALIIGKLMQEEDKS